MLPALLTYEASVSKLSWPGAVDALRRGHQRPRPEQGDLLLGSDEARLLNRAARIEGLGFAVKADSVFPGNARKGLPSVQGAVLLFDPDCGAVRAVIDSRWSRITRRRPIPFSARNAWRAPAAAIWSSWGPAPSLALWRGPMTPPFLISSASRSGRAVRNKPRRWPPRSAICAPKSRLPMWRTRFGQPISFRLRPWPVPRSFGANGSAAARMSI
ncbi:ornithine cyclodeaminase domain-containing protein [Rhizobium sp. N4311]|nr:ornithine cyclodeaminase domain-containing protein [Rhizobium sp. N4311]